MKELVEQMKRLSVSQDDIEKESGLSSQGFQES